MIDFGAMDMAYLLGQIRSDEVISHEELLSILTRKVNEQQPVLTDSKSVNLRNESSRQIQGRAFKAMAGSADTPDAVKAETTGSELHSEGFRTAETWLERDEVMALTVGDRIDLRDKYGKYIAAEIVERIRDKWKIHFIAWSTAWDQ